LKACFPQNAILKPNKQDGAIQDIGSIENGRIYIRFGWTISIQHGVKDCQIFPVSFVEKLITKRFTAPIRLRIE